MAADDVMRSSARIASWEALVGRDQFQFRKHIVHVFYHFWSIVGRENNFSCFETMTAPWNPAGWEGRANENAKSASFIPNFKNL